MKTAQKKAKASPTVSDAALARARASVAKVAASPVPFKQIEDAAQALPDVAIMAGSSRSARSTSGNKKLAATA